MPWYIQVLLVLGPLAAVAAVFLALHLVTRFTGVRGIAPGWQLRCTRCDHTRDAGEAGVTRIRAVSVGKIVFGYCSHCRGFRWIALEHKPESVGSPGTPASTA